MLAEQGEKATFAHIKKIPNNAPYIQRSEEP